MRPVPRSGPAFLFCVVFGLTQVLGSRTLCLQSYRGSIVIDLVRNKSEAIVSLCERYNVKHLEVFGSALTETDFNPETSDIDFLVEFLALEPVEHAKCYFGLLEKLQDMFGRNVDLVEVKAIKNPYLLKSIGRNRGEIYAA